MGDHPDFDTPVPVVGAQDAAVGDVAAMVPRHRTAAFFHVFFKFAAILSYLLCTLLSSSFILGFVLVVLLLVMDFWVVKNVSGRLLVGLRWWNEVDAQGKSQWKFESRSARSAPVNKADSRIFWLALYVSLVVWILFAVTSFFRFNFEWLLLVFVALVLDGANIYGYMKCEKDQANKVKGFVGNYLFSRLTESHVTAV